MTRPVIFTYSGKGGVGKSFASVTLACLLADKGHRVCVLDADERNRTAVAWLANPPRGVEVREASIARRDEIVALVEQIEEVEEDAFVVVDLPGDPDRDLAAAVASDPAETGSLDMALEILEAILGGLQEARPVALLHAIDSTPESLASAKAAAARLGALPHLVAVSLRDGAAAAPKGADIETVCRKRPPLLVPRLHPGVWAALRAAGAPPLPSAAGALARLDRVALGVWWRQLSAGAAGFLASLEAMR